MEKSIVPVQAPASHCIAEDCHPFAALRAAPERFGACHSDPEHSEGEESTRLEGKLREGSGVGFFDSFAPPRGAQSLRMTQVPERLQ